MRDQPCAASGYESSCQDNENARPDQRGEPFGEFIFRMEHDTLRADIQFSIFFRGNNYERKRQERMKLQHMK